MKNCMVCGREGGNATCYVSDEYHAEGCPLRPSVSMFDLGMWMGQVVGAAVVAWGDAIRSREFFKQACSMLEVACTCAVRHGHFSHCPRSKPWNVRPKWRVRADKSLEYIGDCTE